MTTYMDSQPNETSDLKDVEQLAKVKKIFSHHELAYHVRSVRIEPFFSDSHVPKMVLDRFSELLVNAKCLEQIWMESSSNIPSSSVLQNFTELKRMRVHASEVENLPILPIHTLVVDCDDYEAPFRIRNFIKLQSLCIISVGGDALPVLEGSLLPNLEMLSLKGSFGDFSLQGNWMNMRVLNLVGFFQHLNWISQLSPHIRHLALSFPFLVNEDALATDFPQLKVLELHWCPLMKFPGSAQLPQLTYYSESRENGHYRHECELLSNISSFSDQLQVLALRAEPRLHEGELVKIERTYRELSQLRKQGRLQSCLIQAPVYSPVKSSSWLIIHNQHRKDEGRNADQKAWNQRRNRMSLLHRIDRDKVFLESQGDSFPRGAPAVGWSIRLMDAWSLRFPFNDEMQ